MSLSEIRETAQMMIRSYGMEAQAIAEAHEKESREQRDNDGLHRWQQINAAIRELRRTGAKAGQRTMA